MRKIQRAMAAVVLASALAGGTYAFLGSPLMPTAEARWRDHPKLEGAFNSLKDAKEYLENAPNEFHGHKAEAIKSINEAMRHLKICAEEEALPSPTSDIPALVEHPRLHEARDHLKEARVYLHEAPHDFHGHREAAVKAVDEAIHQLDKVLE